MFINKQQTSATLFLGIFVISTLLIHFSTSPAECAPNNKGNDKNKNNNNNNNGNNRNTRNGGLFSSLFRRQTGSSNTDSNSNSESSTEADLEDPQTQTELEAQKFVDSLPIPVSLTNQTTN